MTLLIRIVFSLLLPELERYKETVKRGVLAPRTLFNTTDVNLDCDFVKGTPVFIDPKLGGLSPFGSPPPIRPPGSSTTILVNHLTYNLANENQLDGNKATGMCLSRLLTQQQTQHN